MKTHSLRTLPRLLALLFTLPLTANAIASELPVDVLQLIRKDYVTPGNETRYMDASIDLNGDGKAERIVHLLGPAACGTGGCTTLIFTPNGERYRLVGKISVSRLPLLLSPLNSNSWRNLVVTTGGGGLKGSSSELLFDGKRYPANPTLGGAYVRAPAFAPAQGQVLIEHVSEFAQAQPLPAAPSFACDKAIALAEQQVCSDAALAALDNQVAAAYARAMAPNSTWAPVSKAEQRKQQTLWNKARNACGAERECITSVYRRNLAELQIKLGDLEAPKPVSYTCTDISVPVSATYYPQTDPVSAVLTVGDQQQILFSAPAASGARYAREQTELWEHQGEARLHWQGKRYSCSI